MKALLLTLAVVTSASQAQTVGIDVGSVHVPAHDYQRNDNYGLYMRMPNGVIFGAYHNTIDRLSAYAGYSWDVGDFELAVVAMYGYQKITRSCADYKGCYTYTGFTPGAIAPAAALSYHVPVYVAGFHPRITFMPGFSHASSVFHLSLEKEL